MRNELKLIGRMLLAAMVCVLTLPDKVTAQDVIPPAFRITFTADGRPATFIAAGDDTNWVNTDDPGLGFYVRSRDAEPMRLDRVEVSEGRLLVSAAGALPRVTLAMREDPSCLSFRIERIEGIPASREYSLHFQMHLSREVRVMPTDYMSDARWEGLANGKGIRVIAAWNHLWNRDASNPLGGFLLYPAGSEEEEDETLLNIWVREKFPHPAVEGEWNLDAARNWVARWLAEHSDQSRFWISARTPEELYAAVPYAEQSGARHVYLFTDTWRGGDREPFFTNRVSNWGINTGVFPKGEADLKAFADYLKERNLQLKLHWVSGGIGYRDADYVGRSPDERLAAWGKGELLQPLSPKDKTLLFRPASGVTIPFKLPSKDWWKHHDALPALHPWFDFDMFVVGDELMKIRSFLDTDKDVWRLEIAERGMGSTKPASHEPGTAARGLISAYGSQFIPENDSTLLEEMAQHYAGMLNRCGISNVEYDGAEIHAYNGRMWGFEKFASLVYQHLDHPVTSYTSSGRAPDAHFEYRLHAVQRVGRDRQKGIVPVLLDEPYRPASNLLDAHWGMSQTCAHGFTVYNLMKPEPLFGIGIEALRGHGQTSELLAVAKQWKRVNALITPEQRASIRQTLAITPDIVEQAGSHEKSELVHVVSQQPGRWEIHPTQVLKRAGTLDTNWHDGQEHGAIAPRQFLKPGDELTLANPFATQAPRLILRVLWAFDSNATTNAAAAGGQESTRTAVSDFDYEAMNTRSKEALAAEGNILLQPRASEFRNQRDTRISDDGDALLIQLDNPLSTPLVNEHNLPEWSRNVNMLSHGGLGFWVTGDNSGAVLVVQIPGGDYVLPIDFTGRRYVEIPNAQVAWSTGYWGWRMGAKRTYYDRVSWLKMGFGYLPPESKAEVRVEGLSALKEYATELRNPTFRVGDTRLVVEGVVGSGHYLTWSGGNTCAVFDENWHHLADLPVTEQSLSIPQGTVSFTVSGDAQTLQPWLELQVMTRGEPIVVPDPAL